MAWRNKFICGRSCDVLHGSDYWELFRRNPDRDTPDIVGWRNGVDTALVGAYAAGLILEATRLQVRKFRADLDADMLDWYKAGVQQRYLDLSGLRVVER